MVDSIVSAASVVAAAVDTFGAVVALFVYFARWRRRKAADLDADLDAELQELDDGMFFAALDKKESQKVSEKTQDPYQEISNSNTTQIKS